MGLWVLWLSRLFYSTPENFLNVMFFLILLFLAVGFTLSIPTFIFHKKKDEVDYQKKVYRNSLKWGLFSSLGIIGLFFLKAFEVLNVITGIAFIALYLAFYFLMRIQK